MVIILKVAQMKKEIQIIMDLTLSQTFNHYNYIL